MITRRNVLLTAATLPFAVTTRAFGADIELVELTDDTFPSLEDITAIKPFGSHPPTGDALKKAKELADGAPTGTDPVKIVDYFIREGGKNPDLISQTPAEEAWNPLILEFFRATDYKAKNDMVPWCAAFLNWCLKRAGRKFSGSAASQSFLSPAFKRTTQPVPGNLAVFTCYDIKTGKSVGLGHVAFVAAPPKGDRILVKGGNQSQGGRSMICEKYYPMGPVETTRTINGKKTKVIFKHNVYVIV